MKKILQLFIVVSIGFLSVGTAQAASSDERMRALGAESQKRKPACDQFGKESKALLGKEVPSTPWQWNARSEKLLQLLDSYPGTSDALREANHLYRETENPEKSFTMEDMGSLTVCALGDYFALGVKVLASLPNFPKEKQDFAVNKLLERIQLDLKSPGTMGAIIFDGALLERLAGLNVLPALSTQKEQIDSVHKKTESLHAKIKEALKTHNYPKIRAKEFSFSKELADDWLAILKKADLD